jgi:zinc transport system substrate-binding protein
MLVVDAREGIDLHREDAHAHGNERDPHVWTSPPLVKRMAARIRDGLISLDAEGASEYLASYAQFAVRLDHLDRDLRGILSKAGSRRFMVFHPAWGYFADTYGLTQIPIEREGKQPGARALAALIEQAKREAVSVIFVQPQFDRRSASRLAQAIGGRVETIDPLAADYFANMRAVARLIAGSGAS